MLHNDFFAEDALFMVLPYDKTFLKPWDWQIEGHSEAKNYRRRKGILWHLKSRE